MKDKDCKMVPSKRIENWEEEFVGEAKFYANLTFGLINRNKSFGRLFREYIGTKKVKIKAHKGQIVIEKVEE